MSWHQHHKIKLISLISLYSGISFLIWIRRWKFMWIYYQSRRPLRDHCVTAFIIINWIRLNVSGEKNEEKKKRFHAEFIFDLEMIYAPFHRSSFIFMWHHQINDEVYRLIGFESCRPLQGKFMSFTCLMWLSCSHFYFTQIVPDSDWKAIRLRFPVRRASPRHTRALFLSLTFLPLARSCSLPTFDLIFFSIWSRTKKMIYFYSAHSVRSVNNIPFYITTKINFIQMPNGRKLIFWWTPRGNRFERVFVIHLCVGFLFFVPLPSFDVIRRPDEHSLN